MVIKVCEFRTEILSNIDTNGKVMTKKFEVRCNVGGGKPRRISSNGDRSNIISH